MYAIQHSGQSIGHVVARVKNKSASIVDVRIGDGQPNAIGLGGTRRLLREFQRLNPGVRLVSGDRVTGTRRGRVRAKRLVKVRVR